MPRYHEIALSLLIEEAKHSEKLIPRVNWNDLSVNDIRGVIGQMPGADALGILFMDGRYHRPTTIHREIEFIHSMHYTPKEVYDLYCKAVAYLYQRYTEKKTFLPLPLEDIQDLADSVHIVDGYHEGLSEDDVDPRPFFNLTLELLAAWVAIDRG